MERLSREFRNFIQSATGVLYHIVVVALSAGVALSLPFVVSFLAQDFLAYWAVIENETVSVVSLEIAVAILLIAGTNYLRRSIKDRELAEMAAGAGLEYFIRNPGRFTQRRTRQLKNKHGTARTIMVIGSTGYRTLVDSKGHLHTVLQNCLEAKILLLNPYSEAARMRARAIDSPYVASDTFPEQVGNCIEFLKRLKAAQKSIRLKLYSDPPHVKLAILGDYIWLQHYHASLDVQTMPEYVFKHNQNNHGFYTMFYQYFISRWESPDTPEYDLETDELVYREGKGNEVRREKFGRDARDSDSRDSVEELRAYTGC